MSRFFQAALLLFLSAFGLTANATPTGFECKFPISEGDQSLRRFTLTEEVYRCMRHADASDILVVNRRGQKVPFSRRVASTPSAPKTYQQDIPIYNEPVPAYETGKQLQRLARLTGIRSHRSDSEQRDQARTYYSSLILKREKSDDTLKRITIHLQLGHEPVSTTLIVEESSDLQHWNTLLPPNDLYFLPGGRDRDGLLRNTLNLNAAGESQYLRLAMLSSVENFSEKVISVTGELEKDGSLGEPAWQWLYDYDLKALVKEGEWSVTLPGLFPVSRLRVTPAGNTVLYRGSVYSRLYESPSVSSDPERLHADSLRKVENKVRRVLDGKVSRRSSDPEPWRHHTHFTSYEFQTADGSMTSSDVRIGPVYNRDWKFAFEQPAEITRRQLPRIGFGWRPQRVAFIAQGAGPFHLLVGRDKPVEPLSLPYYLLASSPSVQAVELGSVVREEATAAVPETDGSTVASRWSVVLLWGVLVLGVVLMFVMAYRLSSRMKES